MAHEPLQRRHVLPRAHARLRARRSVAVLATGERLRPRDLLPALDQQQAAGNTVSIDRNASRIAVPEMKPKSRMPRNSAVVRM